MRRWLALVAAVGFGFFTTAGAHPPDENGEHSHGPKSGVSIRHQSAALVLPTLETEAKPWSEKPVLNKPGRFHFAVMTDRTGGHRPGIWMKGVRSVNLLRPEFVVSVGDLIEGYSEDRQEIESQWKEFLGFIDKMQMRFFFVTGNHDVSNPTMHKIWREHFGVEWYSFDYKGVHFVCLCSEDPKERIGDEQLEWLRKDLEKSRDARWTFLFLHKPLWVFSEREIAAGNTDTTNWKQVEQMLGSRPHTVFAGHVHHYVQYQRNGTQYYHLGTTGGGSRLRGIPYGEFDHVTWVTMEEEGPHVAHLLLDGVLAPDVVTEESIARFRQFLASAKVEAEPILIDGNTLDRGEIVLRLINQFDQPVTVSARIDGLPLKGLTLEPARISAEAAANTSKDLVSKFQLVQAVGFEQLKNVMITAKVQSKGPEPHSAELTLPVTIDRRHPCPTLSVTLDGNLDEWTGEVFSFSNRPPVFGAQQQYQGPDDASMSFRVATDGERLYLSGSVTDDQIVAGRDQVYFGIDARPMEQRLSQPRLSEGSFTVEFRPTADGDPQCTIRGRQRGPSPVCTAAMKRTAKGYDFEIGIPAEHLTAVQPNGWDSFQMTAMLLDIDEASDADCFILWRPARDIRRENTNYAHFFRNGDK